MKNNFTLSKFSTYPEQVDAELAKAIRQIFAQRKRKDKPNPLVINSLRQFAASCEIRSSKNLGRIESMVN